MVLNQFAAIVMALITVFVAYATPVIPEPEPDPTYPDVEVEIETEPDDVDVTEGLNFSRTPNPTVTFFVRSRYEQELSGRASTDGSISDALYWRNRATEDRLGVSITHISQPGTWSEHENWNQTLRNAIQTVSHDFDAAYIYAGASSSLATEGAYQDLTDLDFLNLDAPWWDQSVEEGASVYGQLFFTGGDITLSRLAEADVLWYNKDIYRQYCARAGRDSLYDVVRNGEWTIDYLYDLVAEVWNDADRNGALSSGDTVGFSSNAHGAIGSMDAWLYALGADLTYYDERIGEPVDYFYRDHTFDAYDKLVDFYTLNPGNYSALSSTKSTGMTYFYNDNVMFTLAKLSYPLNYGGYLGMDLGVLPLPKYDENQQDYRTIAESSSSLVVVLATVEDSRIDMVSATLEVMAQESYDQVTPAFIGNLLAESSNPVADAEMLQIIRDSMVCSFGWVFSSTNMADMGKSFRVVDGSRDLEEFYQNRKQNYENALNSLLDRFADLS